MNYWLMKTEPDTFSIKNLKSMPNSTSPWDGVRNYQARNFMRDEMKKGDLVLIYHSSCNNIGIAGLATIEKESYPDPTAFDTTSAYYDPKSDQKNPRWFHIDVKWKETFNDIISLKKIKETAGLEEMIVTKKGSRLSITPVTKQEFDIIYKLTTEK